MRRTLAALTGFVVVAAIAIASVALRPAPSRTPGLASAPATSDASAASTTEADVTTTTAASWNTAVSRSDAIATVRSVSGIVDPSSTETAKLMTYGDLTSASEASLETPGTSDSLQIWAVEILGKFTPPFGRGDSYPWGIEIIDANDGSPIGSFAGPESSPPYWNNLPDYSPS